MAGLAAHIRVADPLGPRGRSRTASSARTGPLGTAPNPPDACRIVSWRLDSQPAANPYFAANGAAVADRESSGTADEVAGEAAVVPAVAPAGEAAVVPTESSGRGSFLRNV